MEILVVGPWVSLGLGALLVVVAALIAATKHPPSGLVWLLVFGVLLTGLSIHGLAFLDPYGKFIDTVVASPDSETYGEAISRIGKGKLPERYQAVIVSYAIEHPTEDLEQLLQQGIEEASDPQGKRVLIGAQEMLKQRKDTARLAESALRNSEELSIDRLRRLDPSTRFHVASHLLRMPSTTLDRGELAGLMNRPRPTP